MPEPDIISLPSHAQLVQMGTAHWTSHILNVEGPGNDEGPEYYAVFFEDPSCNRRRTVLGSLPETTGLIFNEKRIEVGQQKL